MTAPEHRARVTDVWDEGPLMRGVRLAEVPRYHAGQALRVYDEAGSSYFALATAHGRGRAPELLLRRGGAVADRLIARLRPGEAIDYDGPAGPGFPLEPARGGDVILVAVGSALSAIRAVIETLLDERGAYGRIALFYGQEREPEFAYAAARDAWSRLGVEIVLCARVPDETWTGPRGLVQEHIARDPRVDPARAVGYLCGMPAMIAQVREVLAAHGLAPERTYLNF